MFILYNIRNIVLEKLTKSLGKDRMMFILEKTQVIGFVQCLQATYLLIGK